MGIKGVYNKNKDLQKQLVRYHLQCNKREGYFRHNHWYKRVKMFGSLQIQYKGKIMGGAVRKVMEDIFNREV